MSENASDVETVLSHRHDNEGDYWATPDGRIYKGNPFSTIGSLNMLHELGVGPEHEAVKGGLELILDACRDDGRIRVAPRAPMYPCYTSEAARTLCRFGLAQDDAVARTVSYLEDEVHETGGWRCSFSRFGKGPETEFANPGATLYALDVLRFFPRHREGSDVSDGAVQFLLGHWETREPLGPCHWGIGETFLTVEYPFVRYNLFYWVYILSFYDRAVGDGRFLEALEVLMGKLDEDGRVVVEAPHRRLAKLGFCTRGEPSEHATRRWREIDAHVNR